VPHRPADPKEERRKLGLFCNVRESAVIEARDVDNIYAVPEAYHAAGLDDEVLAAVRHRPRIPPQLQSWHVSHDGSQSRGRGDHCHRRQYTGMKDAYKSLTEALSHGGIANKVKSISTGSRARCSRTRPHAFLEHVNGIWCPAASASAAPRARSRAQFARERDVPYFRHLLWDAWR